MAGLFADLHSIHYSLGYLFILILLITMYAWVGKPIYKIYRMPKHGSPAKTSIGRNQLLKQRLNSFQKNPNLPEFNIQDFESEEEAYNHAIEILKKKVDETRKKYIPKIFVGTAVSQNGFIDAIIVISGSINLMKEIFTIYNGRVTNADMIKLFKKIYFAMAVSGSDSAVYATDELLTSIGGNTLKAIPFVDKILSSLADGFVSAMLVTRISYIVENYCTMLQIKSDHDLNPGMKVLRHTSLALISPQISKIKDSLLSIKGKKLETDSKYLMNPLAYIMEKKNNLLNGEQLKNTATNMTGNIKNKFSEIFRR
ncbi:MAG: DUF697 domain-containing protein [Ignavibacteria bacterium]|nr:MAG: DUF697 domain-containing protein [Ignavibacteria bacterium]